MAECIEREALLAHLRKCKETSTGSGLTAAVITAIQSFVKEMPLADVAPVVRCRECKFAYRIDGPKGEYDCRKVSAFAKFFKADHFCSFGEKKDGGSDE